MASESRGASGLPLAPTMLVLVLVAMILVGFGLVTIPLGDDRAEVRVVGAGGESKATVDAAVASTYHERYTGLSDHESLQAGEGMLFVHADERERTYVMRDMAFDIDIVFVGADREITAIEHARAPVSGEDGEDLRYTGVARWVLEVPRGYANETEMAVGDRVEIEYQ